MTVAKDPPYQQQVHTGCDLNLLSGGGRDEGGEMLLSGSDNHIRALSVPEA